jgi:hypothetical protein
MSGFPAYRYYAYDYRKQPPERISKRQLRAICSRTAFANGLCGPEIEAVITFEPRGYLPNLTLLTDEARFNVNLPAADFRPSGESRGLIPGIYRVSHLRCSTGLPDRKRSTSHPASPREGTCMNIG